jgi:hypothetical protein
VDGRAKPGHDDEVHPRRVSGRRISAKPDRCKPEHQDTDVRLIAFYLPQYHPIPENDAWWGKGFTEWPGVASARPLFERHYQPHIPADLGFYDLRLPEARAAQAELARQYGIHGFCYHYYWFSGRRILQRPLDDVLRTGEPDFPFCVCWANEPWSRRWDGSESEILIAQEHDLETDKRLILDLLPLFADRRYIRIDGKPLLIIYRVGLLPDPQALFAAWREIARREGLGGLHICMAETFGLRDPFGHGCDSAVGFPPHQLLAGQINDTVHGLASDHAGAIYSYAAAVTNEIVAPPPQYLRFRCVMPGWDNTPRRGRAGNVFHDATPELYELWLREAIGATRRQLPPGQRLVFINAWNEWGEGAHLEPDLRFGRQYLEATRRTLAGLSEWRTILQGLQARLPAAADDLGALEGWLRSFETSLRYLSQQYQSLEDERIAAQPGFVDFTESALAPLKLQLEGTCNIERINQFDNADLIALDRSEYLQVTGWNLIGSEPVTAETESFLTLVGQGTGHSFTTRIQRRIPRADVAEYYKLPHGEALWSGIQSLARLNRVQPGRYAIGVDTRVGSACLRAVSGRVVVVGAD